MRVPSLTLTLLLLGTGALAAAETVPTIKEGMAYGTARGVLIAKGFQPVRSAGSDDRCSAGRQDVCGAYPETVSCSGTGAAACRFIFSSKAGTTLTVVADGQDAGHLKVLTTRKSAKRDADWQRASR